MADDTTYTISQRSLGFGLLALVLLAAIPIAYFFGAQKNQRELIDEPPLCACGVKCKCGPHLPPLPRVFPRRNGDPTGQMPPVPGQ